MRSTSSRPSSKTRRSCATTRCAGWTTCRWERCGRAEASFADRGRIRARVLFPRHGGVGVGAHRIVPEGDRPKSRLVARQDGGIVARRYGRRTDRRGAQAAIRSCRYRARVYRRVDGMAARVTLQIRLDDLSGAAIRALLEEHLRNMYEVSPPES